MKELETNSQIKEIQIIGGRVTPTPSNTIKPKENIVKPKEK